MARRRGAFLAAGWAMGVLLFCRSARAEVIEEIVAWVNGEIISRSDMEQEEQMLLAEFYRRFTGTELDEQVRKARSELLDRMIDRKILLQRASRLYDVGKMGSELLDSFKEQQKVKSNEELQRLLAQEGMTLDELKARLVEMYAPEAIIRFEVIGRISVSDQEVETYYKSHPEIFEEPARVTLREIVLLAEGEAKEKRRPEIERIRERVTAPGADFEAVAREASEAPTKGSGGLLGTVGKGDLAPEIEQAAFSVPVGDVSPVIEFPHGFHLVKVESRTDARSKPLDDVKEQVRSKIEDEKYSRQLQDYLTKARAESEVVVKDKYKGRLSRKEGP